MPKRQQAIRTILRLTLDEGIRLDWNKFKKIVIRFLALINTFHFYRRSFLSFFIVMEAYQKNHTRLARRGSFEKAFFGSFSGIASM